MTDDRKIRSAGKEVGTIGLAKLYRVVIRGDLEPPLEFWSERKSAWLPLAGILSDIEPSRIPQMQAAGISRVEVLGSGEKDCPACTALQHRVYAIEEAPEIPPASCSCVPWCRMVVIAKG